MKARSAILITGASGGMASIVASLLHEKYQLVGVDPRPLSASRPFPGEFFQMDYRSRKLADLFRQYQFKGILHLGRLPLASESRRMVRYNTNVLGTRHILELALKYGVYNVVVSSTFHVYGAHQHNHLHIREDDPLRASQIFPELVDVVELDHVATTFSLKHRDIRTVILRPVNVVGPRIQNRITQFLRGKYCPYVLGYDPVQQFLHEQDFARALKLSLESDKSGIYNIAGEGVIPFTRAIKLAGAIPLPVPHFFAYPTAELISRLGMSFPKHLIDYFRYPTIIADQAFRNDFGFRPDITTVKALRSIR